MWIQPTRPSISLQNLTTLILTNPFSVEALITSAMVESLSKLKVIIVRYCHEIKEIVEDSVHLKNLQVLKVDYCYNLEILLPPSACFPNLTVLVVSQCEKLRKILTPTILNNLPKLQMLDISDCDKVTKIMKKDEEDEMERIVVHSLKTLKLKFLRNLTCFCAANLTLKFPLLEQLYITHCYNMKSFCVGYLIIPRLQKLEIVPRLQQLEINDSIYKISPETNLNTLLSLYQVCILLLH